MLSARTVHSYGRQETLFYEGEPAFAVYCIQSGEVNLFRSGNHGEGVLVGGCSAGDVVGLRAVLSQTPHHFTAKTFAPSVICTIPSEAIMDLSGQCAAFALELARDLARQYWRCEDQLFSRTQQRVGERTARLLVALLHGNGGGNRQGMDHTISMGREEMALLIGTTPETLSRTLHRFAQQQIIAIEGRTIVVLAPDALEKFDRNPRDD